MRLAVARATGTLGLYRLFLGILQAAILASLTFAHADDIGENSIFQSTMLEAQLPKPLSDMTATYLGSSDDGVYIAGGCDDPNGNVFVDDPDFPGFSCGSISDTLYRFDVSESTIREVAKMPRPRYRHAAFGIQGRLWLVGGRDLNDDIVVEVDVSTATVRGRTLLFIPSWLPSVLVARICDCCLALILFFTYVSLSHPYTGCRCYLLTVLGVARSSRTIPLLILGRHLRIFPSRSLRVMWEVSATATMATSSVDIVRITRHRPRPGGS